MVALTMIFGINKRLEHDGDAYDIQAEDDGMDTAVFDLRVFTGGELRWAKQVGYGDLLDDETQAEDLEIEIRKRMERAVRTVEVAIRQGRLDENST